MILSSYSLPVWEFVSGETKERIVTLRYDNGEPYELGDATTARLQILDFVNRDTEPALDTTQTIEDNEDGIHCNLKLSLNASETAQLQGKYLYIAVVTDELGNVAKLRGPMLVLDKSNE